MLGTCILGTPELCRLLTQKCFPWQGLHRFGHGGWCLYGTPLITRSHSSQILIGHWATEEWSCVVSHAPESTDAPIDFRASHWWRFWGVWDGLGWFGGSHVMCITLDKQPHLWSHCHHTYKLTRFSYSMFCLNGTSNSTIKPSHGTPLKINPSDWNPVWWNSTLQLQCTLRNLIWLPFLPHTKKITFGAADHQSWWSWHVPNLHLCRGRGGQ